MGKARNKKNKNTYRHNPLDKQILEEKYAKPSSRQKNRNKGLKDDKYVDNKLANEILKQARRQQEDLVEEHGISARPNLAPHSSLGANDPTQSDNEEEYALCNSDDEKILQITAEISEEDEKAFENFRNENLNQRATLADIIKETLTEKKTELTAAYSDAGFDHLEKDEGPFKELASFLSNYRSGKLPKHFKAIPKFTYWERLVCLTEPDKWSGAAMYQATRIFASNLTDKMAQRFFNRFLLPRCRDEIRECKKLTFHLYQALKKALFKPAAFFKGIILPLCKSDCTLREATIFGSVVAKCSIPVLHSSAALLSIATSDYQGGNTILMRNLIEKKYALPHRVVNAVVDHFVKFMTDERKLPALWHQCLLSFVQLYKFDLSAEQRANLLKLITVHNHEGITTEIRKELQETVGLPNVLQQLWKI